jgi:uncharacterized RDD family membrane protein YckC
VREETVYAVDNVPLDLPIARVGSRVLAAVVDYLILTVAICVLWAVTLAVGLTLSLRGGWILTLVIAEYFLLEHGYFMLSEIFLAGQTPGKRVFRLQVVAAEGSRASTSALVVRNLLRSVDLLAGVILMALDPLARRVGDRLADTRVIHRTRLEASRLHLEFPADWGADEIRTVEGFFARLGELDPAARGRIARRLERYVERRSPALLAAAPAGDPTARLRVAFSAGVR